MLLVLLLLLLAVSSLDEPIDDGVGVNRVTTTSPANGDDDADIYASDDAATDATGFVADADDDEVANGWVASVTTANARCWMPLITRDDGNGSGCDKDGNC